MKLNIGGWILASAGILVNLAAVVLAVFLLTHVQWSIDTVRVASYTPSAAVTGHVTRDTMTDTARFYYLASRPEVQSSTRFDGFCGTLEKGAGVLGCYLPATQRIYLFDVTDSRVDGTEDVVAAHEMLHAAWDRMSAADHDRLSVLVEAAYKTQSGNRELVDRMKLYAKTEPLERTNELWAILGTETPTLGPALEKEYATYFVNRAAVTALHAESRKAINELNARIIALQKKITALDKVTTAHSKKLRSQVHVLNTDIDAFNARATTPGGFATIGSFNAERAALVARVSAARKSQTSLGKQAKQIDNLIADLRLLSADDADLYKSINIGIPPVPEL